MPLGYVKEVGETEALMGRVHSHLALVGGTEGHHMEVGSGLGLNLLRWLIFRIHEV